MSFGISESVRSRAVQVCTPQLFHQAAQSGVVVKTCAEIEDALESRIGVKGTGYTLNWKYDDFQRLDARPFPQHMGLTIGGVKPEVALDMKLSRLSVDNGWESHTNIPSRYKKIEVEELVKMLLK